MLFCYITDLVRGAYLFLGARTEEVFLMNTPKGMDWWMQKICSCGCITVVVMVTDSLYAWSWKVRAHRRDPIGAAAYVKRNHMMSKAFYKMGVN